MVRAGKHDGCRSGAPVSVAFGHDGEVILTVWLKVPECISANWQKFCQKVTLHVGKTNIPFSHCLTEWEGSVLAASSAPECFDIVVIGAGVVGCAVARRFALAGAKVAVLEKGADLLCGASKGNSAILHTGFDAPPDSLELELIRAGRQEYLDIRARHNLPILQTGAWVCAWNRAEQHALDTIAARAHANGIHDVRLRTQPEARAQMPTLSKALVAALEIPGEHVIDPWSAPLAYLTQAVSLGARFIRHAELLQGRFDGSWTLITRAGTFTANSVINCAGLYGDHVDECLGFGREFQIKPRKGQFVVFDKAAFVHVPRILLPVPTQITKGVVLCPTVFGNVLVGPTAEEQEDRRRASVEHATLQGLIARAVDMVPALSGMPVTATYAGLRPATEEKGYRIFSRPEFRAITLGGIRSTGLSSALGLAQHALKLYLAFAETPKSADIIPDINIPNLAEHQPRDWQCPGSGEIICHCESVTRREIEATFATPVPPGDLGGLRRRTRAGMGRCQGFYCMAELADISHGKLHVPLTVDKEAF